MACVLGWYSSGVGPLKDRQALFVQRFSVMWLKKIPRGRRLWNPTLAQKAAQGWGTLYNRVGVVKGHFERASGDSAACERSRLRFWFSLRRRFWFWCCFCFLLIRPRLAFRIVRWKTGSTNHLSGHLTSDRDSLFELPDFLGEARRPISPTMNYSFTRVAHGLPCMRTSCA